MNKNIDEENIVINGFSLEDMMRGYAEMGELNSELVNLNFEVEQEADKLIEKNLVKNDYIAKAE